jgi:hypothetical protein
MKQNTFEPCKDHANGHFNWCLLCENDQKWEFIKQQAERIHDLEKRLAEINLERSMEMIHK